MGGIVKEEIDTITDLFFALGFFSEIIIMAIVICLIYKNTTNLIFYIIFVFINGYLNRFLKAIIKQERPSNPIKFLNSEHFTKNHAYGMPSGHSQNVFFSITYLFLILKQFYPWVFILLIIAFAMLIERWYFHNHTIQQLIVGAITGSIFAYITVLIKSSVKLN
jgi:membrane-associated phospholipid phosphatase